MQTDTVTPAGAETEVVTAEHAAAEAGDFSMFQQSAQERRQGKPRENVARPKAAKVEGDAGRQAKAGTDAGAAGRPAAAVAGKGGAAATGPTDKDREADERLTTRVREAVDTATAESTRRIRELEEQLAAQRRPTSTEKAGASGGTGSTTPTERKGPLTKAEIAAFQAMPGAPKLEDKGADGAYLYDTPAEHAVALSEFIRETREAERTTASRRSADVVERVKREAARVSTFSDRIEAFKRENADLLVDNGKGGKAVPLSPEVAGLHGYAQLHTINQQREARGLPPLPASVDHAIAEELYDSEIPMHVARHLSEHPEELATLRGATSTAQLTRMFGGLEQRVRAGMPAAGSAGGAAAAGAAAAAGNPSKQPTAAELRREAEAAVDRSVSSTKPLNGTLGRAGASDSDPEEAAIAKNDFAGFQEIQRARRLETLQGRQGRR
jgi:hypothetical protein